MAMFRTSPEKSVVKDRDKAKANSDRLAARLADAEQAVIITKSAAQRAALDGDDAALDTAETAERGALHRLTTIRAAHEAANKLLEKFAAQLATVADEKLRSATNAAALALAEELIEAGAAYDAATAMLSEVSIRALAVTMEANGLAVFAASSRIEVAAATTVVAEALRQHGRAVLNGLAKAEMPKPESVKLVPVSKDPTVSTASPPVQFHRVDRPSYQMRFGARGTS